MIGLKPEINFNKHFKIFNIISIVLIILSVFFLLFRGLNYGVDFKGGTLIELRVQDQTINISSIRQSFKNMNLGDVNVKKFGNKTDFLIKFEKKDEKNINFINDIKNKLVLDIGNSFSFRRVENVGPKVSSELLKSGVIAILMSLSAMMIYIWLRFEWQFGFGAVVALTHDVLFTLGVLSILNIEFSLSTIAAVLTIAGYSINDTVVIFDRVRENLRKYKNIELLDLFNMSINNTLSRTVMTSITTLLALISLYLFGGEVIKPFALTMIIGVLVGTYSSIFIAVPTLLIFKFRPQDED